MTRALLFDMDGVLVDTEPSHEIARRAIYLKYGIPPEKTAGIPTAGRNTREIFADVHRRSPFPVPLPQAVEEKRTLFVSLLTGTLPLIPGVEPLLRRYQGSMRLALVSASARSNVEAVLRATGTAPFFTVLICEEDVSAFKPDPEGYLLAASRLGVAAGECVAFEDSAVGVAAAVRAGTRVVAVARGSKEEGLSAADLVVKDLVEGAREVGRLIGQ